MMHYLEYLDVDRLGLLPPEHWAAHEFCFRIHDQMAELFRQYESSGVQHWMLDAFHKAVKENPKAAKGLDFFTVLKGAELKGPYKHHLVSHLLLALTSDMLHFLYEALTCFEKRKFSVGFSLLRKPLKENLLFLAWILGDTDDFIARFEANNSKTLGGTFENQRLEIFAKAISKLPTNEAFSADLMHDLIFSKTNPNGFEPVWQRATHLVTSQGTLLKTEDYELNFVFLDPSSDALYSLLYKNLPFALIFTMQVVLESFSMILKANERTVSHLMLTTMGCYESIFLKGNQRISALLNKSFKPFLKCVHCDTPFRINKRNAPGIYLHERVICTSCDLSSDFPLYWLWAQGNVKIKRDEPIAPFLDFDN